MLSIPPVQLAYIVEKARAFDAETAPVDTDPGSNPSDDNEVAILEATADNPIQQELSAALNALHDEQRIEILALMWLGRGDFDPREWGDALAQARQIHNAHETSYLIGTPLLADYLEEGIAALSSALQDEKKRSVAAWRYQRGSSVHPIADKAETAIDFPDAIYMGQFGQHSRFEAAMDTDGILTGLSQQDNEKREVQIHLHCLLFADVLIEIVGSIASRPPIETLYRDPLIAAVRDLSAAHEQAPAIMAAD